MARVFKRLFWFSSGAATGAAGSWWMRRRVQQQIARFTPGGVRERTVKRAKQAGGDASTYLGEARTLWKQYRQRVAP